jgi:ATP synthase protein I
MPTWRLASVGIEMGVCVALGAAMGWWLDGKFATGPWLMMVFLLLGVAAGFKGMIQAARDANRGQR